MMLNEASIRAYMYQVIPAYYESNTTKVLSYSILDEAERRFSFTDDVKQFMERAE